MAILKSLSICELNLATANIAYPGNTVFGGSSLHVNWPQSSSDVLINSAQVQIKQVPEKQAWIMWVNNSDASITII